MGAIEDYRTFLWHQVWPYGAEPDAKALFLLKILDDIEFTVLVKNDMNRIGDILYLRSTWTGDNQALQSKPCSLLELMVVESCSLSFLCSGVVSDSSPLRWFNELVHNVGFDRCNTEEEIREKAYKVVQRRYDHRGHGGLYPVKSSDKDQREEEIWMQSNRYLIEKYL